MEFFIHAMICATLISLVAGQIDIKNSDVLTVLSLYPQLSKFYAGIIKSNTSSARFRAAENFTLLAPTDAAISTWSASFTTNVSQSQLEATFSYHLLQGRCPSASFTTLPQIIQSELTDEFYANVTGGQRVAVLNNGSVEIQSEAKAVSRIVQGDILTSNGLIHIVDVVLQIPEILGLVASKANLSYFLAFLDAGHYLDNTTYVETLASRRDTTYFAPSSPAAVATFSNMTAAAANSLAEYHCIPSLLYSTDLVNGTELTTLTGAKSFITVDNDGSIYVNAAKVIATDYILYNGVMHLIDKALDPKNTTRTPAVASTRASSQPTSLPSATPSTSSTTPTATAFAIATTPLSPGAKAGIGIGASAGALVLALLGLLLFFRRRRHQQTPGLSRNLAARDTTQPEARPAEDPSLLPPWPMGEVPGWSRPMLDDKMPTSEWRKTRLGYRV